MSGVRERIAAGLEAAASTWYPESVFQPGSQEPDGIAGNAMRHAYVTAARLVREHRLPGDEETPDGGSQGDAMAASAAAARAESSRGDSGALAPAGDAAAGGLRARVLEALLTAPSAFARDREVDDEIREYRRHDKHHYDGTCALCRGEAETLADAVLDVVDEQAVGRVTEEMWQAVRTRSLGIREGTVELDMQGAEDLAASFVGAARTLLEGCENYREWQFTAKVAEEPFGYVFLLQRQSGRTPHELRERAEAQRDAALAQVAAFEDLLGCLELHLNWRHVTKQLTTVRKELFADAVDTAIARRHGGEPGAPKPRQVERRWRDDATPGGEQ